MISINLVPPDLQKKKKGRFSLGKFNIPLEVIIGCGGGLLVLLGVIHVLFLFVNMTKLAQHKRLQKRWETMRPARENIDAVISEMRNFRKKYGAIEHIVENGDMSWARKLNILSDSLPRGVWLKKVALEDDTFFIEGSAVSKETTEIISIHKLTSNLKTNDHFTQHLTDIELGSIQRRKINNVEMADFIITTKLK